MPRVTIIADDGVVGVDGEFRQVDLSSLDANIHAVQWYGGYGEIEWRDNTPNARIDELGEFRQFVDTWREAGPG